MGEPARGTLGVADASLLVVGSIVGAGIFLVSSVVAQSVRSPAAFLVDLAPRGRRSRSRAH